MKNNRKTQSDDAFWSDVYLTVKYAEKYGSAKNATAKRVRKIKRDLKKEK